MTEQEWLNCTEPERMLYFLKGKAADRKLRPFAVACCRHVWPFLRDERSRKTVDVSERYADGLADRRELEQARELAAEAEAESFAAVFFQEDSAAWKESPVREAAVFAAMDSVPAFRVASQASRAGVWALGGELEQMQAAKRGEDTYQCAVLRDLFGNPFRPIRAAASSWLTPDVITLAGHIYCDLAFGEMPGLADALEQAGCDQKDILDHCRGAGAHGRGCWAVDLILGWE